jgi:hypothetical protein
MPIFDPPFEDPGKPKTHKADMPRMKPIDPIDKARAMAKALGIERPVTSVTLVADINDMVHAIIKTPVFKSDLEPLGEALLGVDRASEK